MGNREAQLSCAIRSVSECEPSLKADFLQKSFCIINMESWLKITYAVPIKVRLMKRVCLLKANFEENPN